MRENGSVLAKPEHKNAQQGVLPTAVRRKVSVQLLQNFFLFSSITNRFPPYPTYRELEVLIMSSELTYHVALVSDTSAIGLKDVSPVAASIQKQVTRDFAPL